MDGNEDFGEDVMAQKASTPSSSSMRIPRSSSE